MKFSIVTPSFNQGRFLPDCLVSVQSQVDVNWEHIVIDGGSTDNTQDVLRAHPQVQRVCEPDQGQSDAINKGFRRASGDWVMWLNADDYLRPGALAAVQTFATAHPDTDVIYGDCDYVDEQGRFIRHKREGRFNLQMLLFYGCYIPSTATFLNRRILRVGQVGHLLDVSYHVCMDLEYYLRLARHGYRFEHLPISLACFRWHGQNASIRMDARGKKEFLQLQVRYLAELQHPCPPWPWLLRGMRRVYQIRRAAVRAGRSIGLSV